MNIYKIIQIRELLFQFSVKLDIFTANRKFNIMFYYYQGIPSTEHIWLKKYTCTFILVIIFV